MAIWQRELPSGVVLTHTTTRAEGDFAVDGDPVALAERRRAVADHPWVWLRQVHGARVVVVTADNAAEVAGTEADALVTAAPDVVLAVQTADCVPVTFWSDEGVLGAAHAGWRGLEAGVIGRTLEAMWALGAGVIHARTGPCIEAACYEFGDAELDRLAGRFGDTVRGTTRAGRPALDLRALTDAAMVDPVIDPAGPRWPVHLQVDPRCTACDAEACFSHRARADTGRQATVVWRESSYDRAMARVVTLGAIDAARVARQAAALRDRITAAGGGAEVAVLAVTKGFGPEAVTAALAAGMAEVGENYAQELLDKVAALGPDCGARWHFIGRLQRNKVRHLAPHVTLWQTVDRAELATEIARRAPGAAVLVQLNLSGDPGKGGCPPEATDELVDHTRGLGLDVRGLMGVGPAGPAEAARPGFRDLVGRAERLGLPVRSIGMSGDLEVAVQEGSTMVRVGRDLFGERPPRA